MNNETERRFPAIERRLNFLRQELYTYDKYLRNPQGQTDLAMQAKFTIDAEDYQAEIEELMYLRNFIDRAKQPTGIKTWQAILLVVYTSISLIIAGFSLWIVIGR